MRRGTLALALLLAGAAVAPAALAAPSRLYVHLADPANLDDVPMTAQEPPANLTYREGGGVADVTFSCVPAAPGPGLEAHTVYAVPYAQPADDTHLPQAIATAARGVGYATTLGANLTLHWYLETATQATGPSGDPTPAGPPVPNVVVRATLREGEPIGADASKYDAGQLLASGESAPALLAGPATQGATVDTVDGHTVYNVTVPLTVAAARVPSIGMNLRVDVLVQNPLCDAAGGTLMPPLVLSHSSPGHRPHLDLDVGEPLRWLPPKLDRDQFGSVHYTGGLIGVWGGYAIANASVTVSGPTPASAVSLNVVRPASCGSSACPLRAPTDPAYVLWTWRSGDDHAAAGEYGVNATASDLSGNTLAAPPISFGLSADTKAPLVTNGPPKSSPGPVAALAVLLLLGLASYRKRR